MNRFELQEEFVELMDKALSNLPPAEFNMFLKRVEQELEENVYIGRNKMYWDNIIKELNKLATIVGE